MVMLATSYHVDMGEDTEVIELASLPPMMTSAAPCALSHEFYQVGVTGDALVQSDAQTMMGVIPSTDVDAGRDKTRQQQRVQEEGHIQRRQEESNGVLDEGALMLGTVDVRAPALLGRNCVLSGNLVPYRVQAYVVIEAGVIMRPELRTVVNRSVAVPTDVECVVVHSFTSIGYQTVCEATSVSSFVRMEPRCVVHAGAALPEGVWLREGAVVLSEMVLQPYTMYSGCPAAPCARLARDAYRLMQMEHVRRKMGV